jgi:hypothetical protein
MLTIFFRPWLTERFELIGILFANKMVDLPSIIRKSGILHCTEQVDRIYGILGIAPTSFVRKIQPNYQAPFGEVFKDTFIQHLASCIA